LSVPISGVSGTGAANGVVLYADSLIIPSGVSATGQTGTVKPNVTEIVAGVVGTSSAGAVTATGAASQTLSGVGATGQIESVTINGFEVDVSEKLSGVTATGSTGTLTVHVSDLLSGVSGTTAAGTLTVTGLVTVFNADNFSRARAIRLIEVQSSRRAA
jgi:hypothetical protein